jgi:hypothetical protein
VVPEAAREHVDAALAAGQGELADVSVPLLPGQ